MSGNYVMGSKRKDVPPNSGKPSSFTLDKSKRICNGLAAGNYFETSCTLAGVRAKTAREWLKKGNDYMDGNQSHNYAMYANFVTDVEKAIAYAEASHVKALKDSDSDSAHQFMLTHGPSKHRFCKTTKIEHSGGIETVNTLDLSSLTAEQLIALASQEEIEVDYTPSYEDEDYDE